MIRTWSQNFRFICRRVFFDISSLTFYKSKSCIQSNDKRQVTSTDWLNCFVSIEYNDELKLECNGSTTKYEVLHFSINYGHSIVCFTQKKIFAFSGSSECFQEILAAKII